MQKFFRHISVFWFWFWFSERENWGCDPQHPLKQPENIDTKCAGTVLSYWYHYPYLLTTTSAPRESKSNMAALDLRNLEFSFAQGSRAVFSNVNLTVQKGARMVLVGANGAGKTTLLNVIGGKRRPSSGTATVLGYDSFEYTALTLKMNLVTSSWEEDLTLPVRLSAWPASVSASVAMLLPLHSAALR
jgi:ABC-type molybdenum transport system ATPase subunit/photorepair protein PhrA